MKPAVLHYQRTGAGRRELLERVGAYVYRFPLWQGRPIDEDDCGEFYLYCQPRLQYFIDSFQDQGPPFEAYLKSMLTWQLRSYYRSRRRRDAAWRLAATPSFWDADDAAPTSCPAGAPDRPPAAAAADLPVVAADQDTSTLRRRLLFAVLKHCHRLHDTHVPAWAGFCGRADLPSLIGRARQAGTSAARRARRLRERGNFAFATARMIERQLLDETDTDRRSDLKHRLRRARRTAASAQAELRGVRLGLSNRQVAGLLGIPKGTVDTGMYWLKHRFRPR